MKRGITLTALASACVIGAAPAAFADPTTSPEAYGVSATGTVIPINIANTPDETSEGTLSTAGITLGSILTTGILNATVTSQDETSASVASLGVGSIVTPLLGAVSAGAITSECDYTAADTFTGTVGVLDLSLLGGTLDESNVPANTVVSTPTLPLGITAVTVTANAQSPGPVAGSETVVGLQIVITLLDTDTETIDLASSTCGPYVAGVPLAGGKGAIIGLGGVGLFGTGLAAVYVRRRRNAFAAA